MKKVFLLSVMLIASVITFTSCSKDDEPKFNYPIETLYGTWDATEIYSGGEWIDVTYYPYTKFAMSISFKSDGSFSGKGYLGNGSGTYKAEGNTVITYIDGEEYIRYSIKSLNKDEVEMTLIMDDESIDIRAKKK